MADEELSLGVGVDGVDEAVAQLSEVQAAEKRLEEATRRAAVTMSTENVAAFKKAAAEVDNLRAVTERMTKVQAGMTPVTAAGGTAAKAAAVNVGQMASAFGVAGQAVGKLSPAIGQLTSMTGSALSSVQSLTVAGMGPLGIAVAVTSLAFTAGTAAVNLYTQTNEEAEAKVRSLSEALRDNEYSLTSIMAEQAKARADIQTRIRVASADATTQELEAERDRLNRSLALMRGTALEGSALMTDILRQRLDLEDRLTIEAVQARADRVYAIEAKAARDTADAWIAAAVQQQRDKAAGTGAYARQRSRGTGPTQEEQTQRVVGEAVDPLLAAMESNRAMREADAADQLAAEQDLQSKLTIIKRDAAAENQRLVDQAIDDEQRRLIAVRRSIDREKQERERAAKAQADLQSIVGDSHKALSGIIEAAAGSSEAAKRKQIKTEAALTVIDSGINAAVEVARAAGSYPDVAGMVSHGAAAVGYTVAAAKAAIVAGGGGGAAGSGTPSASAQAGGGGGGAGAGSRPSAFDTPGAPRQEPGAGSRVIVQVGIPMGPASDIGRAARYALAADRRFNSARI